MIFYDAQSKQQQKDYKTYLSLVCSLSRLFSDSNEPYLYYRVAENIFCKTFEADNLSRSDCSADARKNQIGIGLKTFLHQNGRTLQKVAEFNRDRKNYAQYLDEPEKFIYHISHLRNERIEFTKRVHGIDNMIYHCVTRENNMLNLYEMLMYSIDIDSIKLQKASSSSISFKDRYNEYSFNISKSTLLKRFVTNQNKVSIPIEILEDPIKVLLQAGLSKQLEKETVLESIETTSKMNKSLEHIDLSKLIFKDELHQESIILPLYSFDKGEKIVPEKSGLNQWNANGRTRHHDEVYIPIPAWIHRVFKRFFPPRDQDFTLILPNKKHILAKVCQDNSKALMSNPNKILGEWLLRDVLQLKERELLTYEYLNDLGIDSVRIDKIDHNTYTINFAEVGSFDKFEDENKA